MAGRAPRLERQGPSEEPIDTGDESPSDANEVDEPTSSNTDARPIDDSATVSLNCSHYPIDDEFDAVALARWSEEGGA